MLIQARLEFLVARGLVEIEEGVCSFRHVLLQDAAYASLLRADRRVLHRVVAEVLAAEDAGGPLAAERAAVLAAHYEQAEMYAQAWRYWVRAGDAAFAVYANGEAQAHYRRARGLLPGATQATVDEVRRAYVQGGRALELSNAHAEALAVYQAYEAWATTHGDEAALIAALLAQGGLYATFSPVKDLERGEQVAQRVYALAQAAGDMAGEARACWLFLTLYRTAGRLAEALPYLKRGLVLTRGPELAELRAYLLTDASTVYAGLGQIDQAYRALLAGLALWEACDNLPMLADCLTRLAVGHLYRGMYAKAVARAERAYAVSVRTQNQWGQAFSELYLGAGLLMQGAYARGLRAVRDAFALGQRGRLPFALLTVPPRLVEAMLVVGAWPQAQVEARAWLQILPLDSMYRPYALALLAWAHYGAGEREAGAAWAAQIELARSGADPWIQVGLARARWASALAAGQWAEAEALAREHLARWSALRIRLGEPEAWLALGEAQGAQGQVDAARESLARAYTLAVRQGARPVVWRVLNAQAQGAPAETAGRLRARALRVVRALARELAEVDPALEAAFVAYARAQGVGGV